MPFYWFGYVISDNREGKGFWSPLPRLVTNINRWFNGHWDYWSIKDEREYRAEDRAYRP